MKKILVVEDEREFARTIQTRFEQIGYEVMCVYDGLQGLETAREEEPDLIILDVMLPKMDGYKVCGLLKADIRYSKIPIIMLTARGKESDRRIGEEVGADRYITKPLELSVLLSKVRELLDVKEQLV
jgi:DNA-binding response OmpR family regulator